MEAEAAANSAAVQLVSFKDAMEVEFSVRLLQLQTRGLHVGTPEEYYIHDPMV